MREKKAALWFGIQMPKASSRVEPSIIDRNVVANSFSDASAIRHTQFQIKFHVFLLSAFFSFVIRLIFFFSGEEKYEPCRYVRARVFQCLPKSDRFTFGVFLLRRIQSSPELSSDSFKSSTHPSNYFEKH